MFSNLVWWENKREIITQFFNTPGEIENKTCLELLKILTTLNNGFEKSDQTVQHILNNVDKTQRRKMLLKMDIDKCQEAKDIISNDVLGIVRRIR